MSAEFREAKAQAERAAGLIKTDLENMAKHQAVLTAAELVMQALIYDGDSEDAPDNAPGPRRDSGSPPDIGPTPTQQSVDYEA